MLVLVVLVNRFKAGARLLPLLLLVLVSMFLLLCWCALSAARRVRAAGSAYGQNLIKGVLSVTRAFFSRCLAAGGAVTRRYFYLVEVCGDVRKIVRYRRTNDGAVWLSGAGADAGYVCAVYPV